MGRLGCRSTGLEISRSDPRAGSRFRVLLSDRETRRHRDGRAGLLLVGDILSHTLSPLISRAIWPLMMAKIFGPNLCLKSLQRPPKEIALRPSQIRASAAESAL